MTFSRNVGARYYTSEARSVCLLPFLFVFFCGFSVWRTVLEVTWVRERRSSRRQVRAFVVAGNAVTRNLSMPPEGWYVWFRLSVHSPVFATSDVCLLSWSWTGVTCCLSHQFSTATLHRLSRNCRMLLVPMYQATYCLLVGMYRAVIAYASPRCTVPSTSYT